MASQYSVYTATFQPFSYDELAKPLIQQTEVHEKLADAYSDQATLAESIRQRLNPNIDTAEIEKLNGYMDDLNSLSGDLGQNGLNNINRNGIRGLRSRYAKEILPMETAFQYRLKMQEAQMNGEAKGIHYQKDAATTPLSEFINNPNWSYGKSYNVQDIYKYASDVASKLSRYKNLTDAQWRAILGGQYFERISQSGYSPEQIASFLASPDASAQSAALQIIYDSTYNMFDLDWTDNTEHSAIVDNAIKNGLWSAVGTEDADRVANQDYINAYQRWQMSQRSANGDDLEEQKPINYVNFVTGNIEPNVNIKKINSDIERLSKMKESGIEVVPSELQSSNTKWENAEGPFAAAYKTEDQTSDNDLIRQYGGQNIDNVIKQLEGQKTVVSTGTVHLNYNDNGAISAYINSVWNNRKQDRKKDIKELIQKRTGKGNVTSDELSDLLKSRNLQLGYDPFENKVLIGENNNWYEADPSLFYDLQVPFGNTLISGDQYLKRASEFIKQNNELAFPYMNTWGAALIGTLNSFVPAASSTSSEAATWK